jgi:hypothetical protein
VSELSEAASRYARMGLAVIPLEPKGKIPMFKNWPEVATNDLGIVTRWWTRNPYANVGIATGQKSRIFVVDIDPDKGGIDSYESLVLKHGRFPDTWQTMTGRPPGFHMYFRYPNFRVENAAGIFPGIDIRGDRGQVVAPPSIHPNGNRYEWDGAREIENIEIPEAPGWLLEALQGKSEQTKSDKFPLPFQIPKGVQHETLVAAAGMMRRLGLEPAEILPSLLEINRRRCAEPGPQKNIEQIAESMAKYRPGDADLFSVASRLWRATKARECENEREQQQKKKNVAEVVDGLTIYREPATDQRCVVENLLFHGLTVFAGRPKVGKSYLVLQLALAVAHGVPFLGSIPVLRPGGVIYAALEESKVRTGKRMRQLWPSEDPLLQNISVVYSLSPLMEGGQKQLDELLSRDRPNLVVVDTFLALVGSGNGRRDVMRAEYAEINVLHALAEKHDTAIVLVHHLRKGQVGESGLDAVAGSTGVTAAADAIWTMKREDQGTCSLDVVGREAEEQSLGLRFMDGDQMGWKLMGTGEEVRGLKDEREIMELLHHEGAQTCPTIAKLLKMNANNVRTLLYGLSHRGSVNKNSNGKYCVAQHQPERETE